MADVRGAQVEEVQAVISHSGIPLSGMATSAGAGFIRGGRKADDPDDPDEVD
jgi:hypothetical protein